MCARGLVDGYSFLVTTSHPSVITYLEQQQSHCIIHDNPKVTLADHFAAAVPEVAALRLCIGRCKRRLAHYLSPCAGAPSEQKQKQRTLLQPLARPQSLHSRRRGGGEELHDLRK